MESVLSQLFSDENAFVPEQPLFLRDCFVERQWARDTSLGLATSSIDRHSGEFYLHHFRPAFPEGPGSLSIPL